MHVIRTMVKAMELFATTERENETLPNVTVTAIQEIDTVLLMKKKGY